MFRFPLTHCFLFWSEACTKVRKTRPSWWRLPVAGTRASRAPLRKSGIAPVANMPCGPELLFFFLCDRWLEVESLLSATVSKTGGFKPRAGILVTLCALMRTAHTSKFNILWRDSTTLEKRILDSQKGRSIFVCKDLYCRGCSLLPFLHIKNSVFSIPKRQNFSYCRKCPLLPFFPFSILFWHIIAL